MNKNNTSLVPKIRFPEFTDDWEQRKLGEVFEEYSEKKHEELPPLTIIQGGGTILREESDRALQYDKNSLSGYKMVKKNDFIVHLRSFEGGLEKANSDGIISPAYHTFHGDNTDSRFYYPFFRSRRFIDVLLKPHVYGIRDGKSIDIEGMKTIMIPVPSYAEQKKIGEYIESLDNLITLHQRKLLTTKKLKKAMLQKMFPKNGCKVPEVRFKGFTDDWEQCKLSELSENITVGIANSATHAYKKDGIVMFRNQNIKENYLDDSDVIFIDEEFEKKYVNKRLKANDLLVARTGYPGTACVVPEKYQGSQTFTTLIARLKEGTNPFYACQYINSDYGKKYFLATQIGGGQKNSGAGILEDFPMILPPTIEEQERIADYLKHFDNLITLHQRKLDLYEKLKKGMLQKMFV